ncbi:MAG: hypothetical protein LBS74_07485 [Oscillospiraceae bacterium]|jgi:hypothetical protein|nr:hypothetical protein [Oscillospiraceae bacterium]
MNNNIKSNPVEDELNAIRINLYEQTKDMTQPEQNAFFRNMAKAAFAKHGIKAKIVQAPIVRRQGTQP